MRVLIGFVAGITAVLIALSYGGAWHPAGDSFAVIRYPLVGFLLVLAILRHRLWIARAGIIVCAVLLVDRALMARAVTIDVPDFVIYQKNMKFLDYDAGDLARDIVASGAQIVTLQEVSAAHHDFLEMMKNSHPHQLVCGGTRVGAVVILSRDPIVGRTCSDPAGIAVADVAIAQGQTRLRVASVHLHWPWPFAQAEGIDAMLADLDGLTPQPTGDAPAHVVVGGDFNMVPWGHALRRIETAFGVERIGHVQRTFNVFGWPLTIDHVMAGRGARGTISVRPLLGSDHHGVVGRVVFTAP